MPRVRFTAHLARHTAAPECHVEAGDVAGAFEETFRQLPALRGYVLDDQGAVRRHVAVFVDGVCVVDRERLSDTVRHDSEILVMQSLSGG
jgi:sulfur carrier protein ThiS